MLIEKVNIENIEKVGKRAKMRGGRLKEPTKRECKSCKLEFLALYNNQKYCVSCTPEITKYQRARRHLKEKLKENAKSAA